MIWMQTIVVTTLVAGLAGGCDRAPATPAPQAIAPPGATAMVPIEARPPAEVADPTGVPGSSNLNGVGRVLAEVKREAATRAPVKVATDQVFAALQAAGIPVQGRKQVYGGLVGAQYCEAAAAPGVAISVCEYLSEAAATSGMATANTTFKTLAPQITRTRNATTVLTVNLAAVPQGSTLPSQIVKVFTTLGGRA